ncbi:MAG: MFS transporter [Actinomycetia bacterium]|nr:MFS transporter [Actinomycetes bacterium]
MSDSDQTPDAGTRTAADSQEPTPRLGASYYKLFGASTVSNLGDGVGIIAYPWLASAVTRNGFLIALVAVVQRLPWLFFTLPAGVITDRSDRRMLMIWASWTRALLTLLVAAAVLVRQGELIGPDQLDAGAVINNDYLLYWVLLLATFLLGIAEVLYDNTAQTFMPAVVHSSNLEKANGRLWSSELVTNTFAGPPLGALLLVVAFSTPFFFDAATFALSAVLITLIPRATGARSTSGGTPASSESNQNSESTSWRQELKEGVRWLWGNDLLRNMAIILGLLNMLGMMSGALLVLFAQEVLETSPTEFAILSTGGAIGGAVGGWVASQVAEKIGSGPSLALTMIGGGLTSIVIGLVSLWPVVWLMFAIFMFVAVLWNVITVSFRQTVIPDQILGRANSVYRFFAWGMMPVGAILGGLTVTITELVGSRELALRMPWLVAGVAQLLLLIFAAPRLTSEKLEAARAEATAG